MRSKWYRGVALLTLVAVFAVGTMAASGGHREFRFGAFGGDPLKGVAISDTFDPALATPAKVALFVVVTFVGAFLGAAGGYAFDRIAPFRQHPGGSMSYTQLDESVFDPS